MNQPDLDRLIERLRGSGAEQFASWNAQLFEFIVASPMLRLKQSFESQRNTNTDFSSLANYVRMAYEGIGAGLLVQTAEDAHGPNFLTHCMVRLIPNSLCQESVERRAAVMKDVWNLAEGLSREPLWLNRYVVSQLQRSVKLSNLPSELNKLLTPVLSSLPPADWNGSYTQSVINLRHSKNDFLPGRLYLAAPAVLCIESRCDEQQTLGILLQKPGGPKPLGDVGKLPEHTELFDPPDIVSGPDSIMINGHSVATPLLAAPQQALAIACGFVAAIAQDSQRLWLIEAN